MIASNPTSKARETLNLVRNRANGAATERLWPAEVRISLGNFRVGAHSLRPAPCTAAGGAKSRLNRHYIITFIVYNFSHPLRNLALEAANLSLTVANLALTVANFTLTVANLPLTVANLALTVANFTMTVANFTMTVAIFAQAVTRVVIFSTKNEKFGTFSVKFGTIIAEIGAIIGKLFAVNTTLSAINGIIPATESKFHPPSALSRTLKATFFQKHAKSALSSLKFP